MLYFMEQKRIVASTFRRLLRPKDRGIPSGVCATVLRPLIELREVQRQFRTPPGFGLSEFLRTL